ncbi:MAG: hypothetical protein NTZ05_20660 [Chloroflexi bacterium]|nr:hypothetical protein [Chloroflexota bacterium]
MKRNVAKSNARESGLDGGDGCEVRPHCLTCDLDRCIYDDPPDKHQTEQLAAVKSRRDAIAQAHEAGLPVSLIVEQLGVSKRTAHRALQSAHSKG